MCYPRSGCEFVGSRRRGEEIYQAAASIGLVFMGEGPSSFKTEMKSMISVLNSAASAEETQAVRSRRSSSP
jgi:hypothetical protein